MVRQVELEEEERCIKAEQEEWNVQQAAIDAVEEVLRQEQEDAKSEEQKAQEAIEREEAEREMNRLMKLQEQIEAEEWHQENDHINDSDVENGTADSYEKEIYDSK